MSSTGQSLPVSLTNALYNMLNLGVLHLYPDKSQMYFLFDIVYIKDHLDSKSKNIFNFHSP